MKFKTLNNGHKMPCVGLGTWLSAPGQVSSIVEYALLNGYRHIDCAACYDNEVEVGQGIKQVLASGSIKRDEIFITSKLWNNAHKKDDVIPALKKTLSDLGLEYLDLYLIHWPVAFKPGVGFPSSPEDYLSLDDCPIIETYRELEKAHEQGLIKSIGVSNFSVKKLSELVELAHVKPTVNQVELHPFLAQKELLNYCNEQEIALTCYSPLGSSGRPPGMLADNEPSLLANEEVVSLAKELACTPAQLILAWGIERGTIVIPKTVTPSRADENLKAQEVSLTPQVMERMNKLDRHFRYVNGEFFTPEGSPYTLANLWDE
jgi:alcohol dehydrogenase (NADP+)